MSVSRVGIVAVFLLVLLGSTPAPAMAYVGPGSGISAIGAAFALVGSIVLAIIGFIWYPLKRLLGRFRRDADAAADSTHADPAAR